jgi:hypothetical protein
MATLMELTKQVTYKMKMETTVTHTSPKFQFAKVPNGNQLHDLDIDINENYDEIKKLK